MPSSPQPVAEVLAALRADFEPRVSDIARFAEEARVVSAEDLVAMKILAGRPHDLEDVAAIVRAHRDDLNGETVRTTLTALETALDRRDLVSAFEHIVAAGRRDSPGRPG